jgi:hypothetical protein
MNAWEGQVLAVAVKELFEAVRTLGRDGFGRGERELSAVIRDLLSVHPNVSRAQAVLEAIEARQGSRQSADLFVAKRLLAAVRKRGLLDERERGPRRGIPLTGPPPSVRPMRARPISGGLPRGELSRTRRRAGTPRGSTTDGDSPGSRCGARRTSPPAFARPRRRLSARSRQQRGEAR